MALFRNTLFFPLAGILLFPTQAFTANDVDQYLEELERAEVQYGAYDQSMADAYFGLGAAYEANQELNEAADAYLRGLHIQRVNNGLFDEGQIAYLEELAELEVGRSNWLEGSKHLKRAHAITAKNHPPGSMLVQEAASGLIDLHLQAYALGVKDWDKHLDIAHSLNQKQLIRGGWENEDIAFTQERYQLTAYINYKIYVILEEQVQYEHAGANKFSGHGLTPYFRQGRMALQANVFALKNADAEPVDVAQGLAQVGDWYALFGQMGSANKYYQEAFDVYAASNGEEAATEQFSEPLRIPTFGIGGTRSNATKKFQYGLDVTAAGRTKNLTLLTDKEGHSVRDLRSARSTMQAMRFRPALSKDGPVAKLDTTITVALE